jgi:dynein heavy chain, axonemal
MSKRVGIEILPNEDFTFSQALSMGLLKNVDACIEISEQATKEWNIENNLNEMIKAWDNINFEFTQFKTSYVIKTYDDAVALVDDHIANTQAMLFSPFKKPFEEKIMEWFNTLKRISDILEEWAKLQINWMYLQPIFDSPDIAKQLHKESKIFKQTDSFWKAIINRSREHPNVMKICNFEDLLDKIKENNNSLDVIQKSLNNYLESKRAKFARFFFLSNNELLEILSQAKDPLAVQPYLKKVFENIN